MATSPLLLSLLLLCFHHLFFSETEATTFTIVNKCSYTVWAGILSNAGVPPLSPTGFALEKGESKTVNPAAKWGGRFWGRTLCATDSSGKFTCQTGDCGSSDIQCAGAGATPPATLAEFTLNGDGGLDFFDVSLVDGYNLPMLVTPVGGSGGNCTYTGCVTDLAGACPSELRVMSEDGGQRVACKSACDAFNQPQYCCSGAYASPDTCKPSSYSEVFKRACPRAYSYAYDDKTSTFTCGGNADYTITFCPSPTTSQKASASEGPASPSGQLPLINSTMIYEGALGDSSDFSSAPSTWTHVPLSPLIAGALLILTAICQFLF